MERVEITRILNQLKQRIEALSQILKINELNQKLESSEQLMFQEHFWDDLSNAKKIVDEVNTIKDKISEYQFLKDKVQELEDILSLDDDDLLLEIDQELDSLSQQISDLETKALLSSDYDNCNCYLEIHPGAGGTESQDWALMLFRMYKRFCERHKFNISVMDYQDANDAGIKSVTLKVDGTYAYGMLKSENGVHRLIRISPFDSNARRHTSFAGITVIPEIEEQLIEINPADLRIDTYRSSGAGGQYVNTTDSAVRITHIPTGIVVTSQNERSQIQNRVQCMKMLEAKLYQLHLEENKGVLKDLTNVKDNAFGSQIRTYTLQPYTLVKDHRTNFEMGSPERVLDGDLDGFINAYLKYLVQTRGV